MVVWIIVRSSRFIEGVIMNEQPLSRKAKAAVLTAAFLGLVFDGVELVGLPESPAWLASRGQSKRKPTPFGDLVTPPLLRITLIAIWFAPDTSRKTLDATSSGETPIFRRSNDTSFPLQCFMTGTKSMRKPNMQSSRRWLDKSSTLEFDPGSRRIYRQIWSAGIHPSF